MDIEVEEAKHRYDVHGIAGPADASLTALLLAHGADISARTSQGETPLAWATQVGHKAAEALLRERGAPE